MNLDLIRRLVAIVLTLTVLGCQITPTFTTGYQFERAALRPAPLGASLAVRRFQEGRPPRLYSTTGRLFLTYIPLVPYVTMPFERLDESVRITSESIQLSGRGMTLGAEQNVAPPFEQYTYPVSMARAIADDLRAAGIFTDVVYVGSDEPAGQRFVLTGTLRETPLRTTTTSFGLGMAGVLLWLLPVPISKTTGSATLDVELTDNVSGQVVWRKSLTSELSRLITLYTSSAIVYGRAGGFSFGLVPPPSDAQVDRHSLFSWHFEALRRAMVQARPEIATALRDR